MHKVFVYGTLKEGHGNHGYLSNSKLIKQAYISGFLLINTGGFPYAIEAEPTDFAIGEVYEVDDETLRALDRLEGYPSHYQRRKVDTYHLDSILMANKPRTDEAWIYYIQEDTYGLVDRNGTTHEWGRKPEPINYGLEVTDKSISRAIAELFGTKGE